MFSRLLILILLSTSQAVAQTGSSAYQESLPVAPESRATLPAEKEQYTFRIRFISTREEIIQPLRKLEHHAPIFEPNPFANWRVLDAKSTILAQRIETQVEGPYDFVVKLSETETFDLLERAQNDSRTDFTFSDQVTAVVGDTATITYPETDRIGSSGSSRSLSREIIRKQFGTRIDMRAIALEDGRIQADAVINYYAVGDSKDVMSTLKHTTAAASGILDAAPLTMVFLPVERYEPEIRKTSPIQRVANVVRAHDSEKPAPAPLLMMITVMPPDGRD